MYAIKDYKHLLGMNGLSDALLTNHFALYEGYVNNTNILMSKMNVIREERFAGDDSKKEESAELHRRYSWEYNGMRLHELYFENITKESTALDMQGNLAKSLIERFGSYDAFVHNFKNNVGMFRGIGWVALVKRDDGLGIIWINEHNEGLLADSKVIVIMDVFEHAFMLDYGIKRAEYIQTFFTSIDWQVAENRFNNVK